MPSLPLSAFPTVLIHDQTRLPTPGTLGGHKGEHHVADNAEPTTNTTGHPTTTPPAVHTWLSNLLDLTRRNPLICLPSTAVALHTSENTLPTLITAITSGTPIVIRGSDDLDELDLPTGVHQSTDLDSSTHTTLLDEENLIFAVDDTATIRKRFPDLRRCAHVIRDQSGASPLYLTLGALTTHTNGSTDTAPLYLLPITLEGRRYGSWTMQLETQGTLRINESLLERLRRNHSIDPQALRDLHTSDDALDLPGALERIRQAITQAGIDAEVTTDARIALLEYSTLEMWRDLHDNWATYLTNPLLSHLTSSEDTAPPANPTDGLATQPLQAETELTAPLPADGAQQRAIAWAHDQHTFVLEGPPGTGKSQTITNIVADALANGRRVLFVAEKDAALDVVARRLAAIGLHGRCLDLRSKEQTLRGILTHLSACLAQHAIPTSEDLTAARDMHREIVTDLARHPAAIREHGTEPIAVDASARREQAEQFRYSADTLRSELAAALPHMQPAHPAPPAAMEALSTELTAGEIEGLHHFVDTHIDAILTLTPCLLMSPATVARYLPARAHLFDLVIFDEASQIRVADAVGSLGRSDAAIIVGDPKQMPPTNLFGAAAADEADRPDEAESILLEAVRRGIPCLRLTWHYRSRTEGLVAFSNERYYGGELASFPTPPGTAASGVEFRRVEGGFFGAARRKPPLNIVESNEVVATVREMVALDPDVSVGVITFNAAQRDDILDKLESDESAPEVRAALRRENEPIFVKNIEHVQGDERDHILFSLTYSLHDADRLSRDYGLLRHDGGQRRLNVAITRARVRNVLFASYDPDVFDHIDALPDGLADLRDYLRAARYGQIAEKPAAATETSCLASPIAARLRAEGLEAVEDVGVSAFRVDLALRRPGRSWVAVGLDTPQWARRLATTDRDEIPQRVLVGQMGWAAAYQLYRSEWSNNPDQVIADLVRLADEAPIADAASSTAATSGSVVEPDPLLAAAAAQAQTQADIVERMGATPIGYQAPVLTRFEAAEAEQRGSRETINALPEHAAVEEVAAQWREIVEIEGPVHIDRAARIVARRFGWRRMPGVERDAIVAAMPPELERVVDTSGEFVWGEGVDRDKYRVVRGQNRAERRATEIAPEERANAVLLALAESGGKAGESTVLRGVKEIFGFGFLATQLRPAFWPVIENLVASGQVQRQGRELVLVQDASAARERSRVG